MKVSAPTYYSAQCLFTLLRASFGFVCAGNVTQQNGSKVSRLTSKQSVTVSTILVPFLTWVPLLPPLQSARGHC